MTVYLHVIGDGSDGNEAVVEAVYATRELADQAIEKWLRYSPENLREYRRSNHFVEERDVLTAVEG